MEVAAFGEQKIIDAVINLQPGDYSYKSDELYDIVREQAQEEFGDDVYGRDLFDNSTYWVFTRPRLISSALADSALY